MVDPLRGHNNQFNPPLSTTSGTNSKKRKRSNDTTTPPPAKRVKFNEVVVSNKERPVRSQYHEKRTVKYFKQPVTNEATIGKDVLPSNWDKTKQPGPSILKTQRKKDPLDKTTRAEIQSAQQRSKTSADNLQEIKNTQDKELHKLGYNTPYKKFLISNNINLVGLAELFKKCLPSFATLYSQHIDPNLNEAELQFEKYQAMLAKVSEHVKQRLISGYLLDALNFADVNSPYDKGKWLKDIHEKFSDSLITNKNQELQVDKKTYKALTEHGQHFIPIEKLQALQKGQSITIPLFDAPFEFPIISDLTHEPEMELCFIKYYNQRLYDQFLTKEQVDKKDLKQLFIDLLPLGINLSKDSLNPKKLNTSVSEETQRLNYMMKIFDVAFTNSPLNLKKEVWVEQLTENYKKLLNPHPSETDPPVILFLLSEIDSSLMQRCLEKFYQQNGG